jgi:hypothetical protein
MIPNRFYFDYLHGRYVNQVRLFFFKIVWFIWNARNNLIFNEVETSWNDIYYSLLN